jgi:hypothetical protein
VSIWRDEWTPPYQTISRSYRATELKVGMVIGFDYRAWEVTHVKERETKEGDKHDGHDRIATFRRLHGPRHDRENRFRDVPFTYSSRAYGLHIYRDGIVWLCSCCSHPVPCRMQVAKELSEREAATMESRLNRMGPGICYGCGEVITQRQERITMPGEHADFPGRSGPTFHTRQKCGEERWSYAKRAGIEFDGTPVATLASQEDPDA